MLRTSVPDDAGHTLLKTHVPTYLFRAAPPRPGISKLQTFSSTSLEPKRSRWDTRTLYKSSVWPDKVTVQLPFANASPMLRLDCHSDPHSNAQSGISFLVAWYVPWCPTRLAAKLHPDVSRVFSSPLIHAAVETYVRCHLSIYALIARDGASCISASRSLLARNRSWASDALEPWSIVAPEG